MLSGEDLLLRVHVHLADQRERRHRRLGLGRILGDAIGAHLAEHEGRVGGLAVLRSVQVISGAAAGGVSAKFRHGAR